MLGANKEAYMAREGWGVQLKRQLEPPWELGAYFEMRSPWRILNSQHQIYVVGAIWRTICAGTRLGTRAHSGGSDNSLGEVTVALTRVVAVKVLRNCKIQAIFSKSSRKDWL